MTFSSNVRNTRTRQKYSGPDSNLECRYRAAPTRATRASAASEAVSNPDQ